MIDKIPEDITLMHLEVVVMPNGEVVHNGKSLGWIPKGIQIKYLSLPESAEVTTLQKLYAIEKVKVIYDIHYCNAGVGFVFFDKKMVQGGVWKTGLSCEKYYSNFESAVDAEYKKL